MYEVIETINLTKEFLDFWGRVKAKAVNNLNIKVYKGEIFGLLGPNGSGKTTTIKLLLGLLFPTKGKIKILDGSPFNVKNKKRIGFLPEETYLYPYHTAEESLYFYGRLFGYSPRVCKKRVQDLLEMVGLTKAKKRPLKEFSKGMARRIGIAQALINDPELIFLDEPTTGLDPIGTREVKDLILNLKEHGKTVLLCSHLLADVEDICDRIAILYGGQIRVQGNVKELLQKKSTIQLSLENMEEKELRELTKWLEEKNIKYKLDKPKEKLETFFLKIIEEAREKKIKTSGAEIGKKIEDFFSSTPTPKNKIIADLVKKKTKPQEIIEEHKIEDKVKKEEKSPKKEQKDIIKKLTITTHDKKEKIKIENKDKLEEKEPKKENIKDKKTKDILSKLIKK